MGIRLAGNLFKTSDFIQCPKVILAVSGGSDSLALLFLVKDYLKTLSVPPEMIAVTVDHQLRKESAREASIVAEICRDHHIKHIIVRWEGKKPKTHLASSARIARYNLLFKEAQKQGATLIMTGHTLNDQAETYQMRFQRLSKSLNVMQYGAFEEVRDGRDARKTEGVLQREAFEGVWDGGNARDTRENIAQRCLIGENDGLIYARGLSCIPREALLLRKIRLIRPLLGVKRETLRTYLRLQGKTWIDDPTNEDLNFERVRVRHSLHSQKLTGIAQRVHEAALKRRQQAQIVADLILALDIAVEYGRCFIAKPAPFLQQHPSFSFVVGLFAVLMGGSSYLLPAQKLITLVQKLCLHSPQKQRFTLAGSVIECNKNGIALWRESRNMKEAVVAPGETFLWDGRYQITNHGVDAIKVGAAGLEQLKALLKNSNFDLKNPHFPSLQSLLMLSHDKGCDIPELTLQTVSHQNVMVRRIMAPFDWLFSCEDAALVRVVEPFFKIEVKR
ncbi:tRNA(Ile)-lysidine synthase [Bartonella vinsonii subsp. arupensis Pm136co]|uniref:tRNA(Ile)-lysidine synthase n=1 Tax=Bartonella vinsonii subsp. arupensis Pm136co TaxID=1094561 RepID=A0ABN0GPA3_BARVI|nr:tRNA lysidine(34) synthetase TilS [Bartonella vinsonii]EJF98086.1 tRNA(Ile)-lysidine synthase [Bartonella vinsonii subsp. arupensis Pm136co]